MFNQLAARATLLYPLYFSCLMRNKQKENNQLDNK